MTERKLTVNDRFMAAVDEAISHGANPGEYRSFNVIAGHAVRLLQDAYRAYEAGSFGTATFLAITAIEETAKAEVTIYRRGASNGRRGDPLYNHKKKHLIGVRPTTFMSKLPEIIGQEASERLQQEAQSGALIEQRERALYVCFGEGGLTSPAMVSLERAKEVLLLSLFVADDVLVGYTNYTGELEIIITKLIDALSSEGSPE